MPPRIAREFYVPRFALPAFGGVGATPALANEAALLATPW
jgi:hypothetical protein